MRYQVKASKRQIGGETSRSYWAWAQGLSEVQSLKSKVQRRLRSVMPNGQQAGQAEEQQGADGERASVGVLREEIKRGRADCGAGKVAQADPRRVDSAVLAFGVAEVHGVKQR